MIRLTTTGNGPHQGTQGTIIMIVPFFLFFFFFSITYSIFTGKPPTIGLAMMWKRPHKGTPGTIIMIVPFFFYFFEY